MGPEGYLLLMGRLWTRSSLAQLPFISPVDAVACFGRFRPTGAASMRRAPVPQYPGVQRSEALRYLEHPYDTTVLVRRGHDVLCAASTREL